MIAERNQKAKVTRLKRGHTIRAFNEANKAKHVPDNTAMVVINSPRKATLIKIFCSLSCWETFS